MSNPTGNEANSLRARDSFLEWAAHNRFTLGDAFEWVNARTRYDAVCPQGHACGLLPYSLKAGQGGCRTCGREAAHRAETAKRDGTERRTDRARRDFLSWAADNGFTLEEPFEWRGVAKTYAAVCPQGHPCKPRPNSIQQGQTGCLTCSHAARRESAYNRGRVSAAQKRFLSWAADNGFVLGEPFEWRGTMLPHAATCPQGHVCHPTPTHVFQGIGGCASCAGKVWDAFYVVQDTSRAVVKFGVTSGDPRPRLRDHARNGFTNAVRVLSDLPDGGAAALERELMALMRCAGVRPVQGREYFPDAALNSILAVVDNWFD